MIYLILVFAAIFYASLRPIWKRKQKRDLIWVGILYLFTLAVCILVAAGVNLPSSSMALADLMKSIGFHYPPLQ